MAVLATLNQNPSQLPAFPSLHSSALHRSSFCPRHHRLAFTPGIPSFPRTNGSCCRSSRIMMLSAHTADIMKEAQKTPDSSRSGSPLRLTYLELEDLPQLDLLLITQNFDDHCHKKTLEPLSKMFPNLQVISTPNAQPTLSSLFQKVIYLEPGHSISFTGRNGSEIIVRATAGPILGPPWQRPENGYFVEAKHPQFTIYYEPHCVYNRSSLKQERTDVIVTPVIKQVLPLFTLVSGQEDAVELARLLQAKIVVSMKNGDLESKGLLSKLISSVGSVEEFRESLQKSLPAVQLLEPMPGIPLEVPIVS